MSRSILCFGEVLLRLSTPPGTRLSNSSSLFVHVGGAEANVGAMLAQLGHPCEMVSVLPQGPIGDLCEAELRRTGLGTSMIPRKEGRLGLYFFDPSGEGEIIYDREGSAFSKWAGEFDWAALAPLASWFHLSGINLAIGDAASSSALEAARAMRSAGVTISFDVNHRKSLWEGRGEKDRERLVELVGLANILFASASDISRILRLELSCETGGERRSAAEAAFEAFGGLEVIASTHRTLSSEGQRLTARVDRREGGYETPEAPIRTIIDRIGSGDAFAGAVIDRLIAGAPLEDCARVGLGAALLKHSISGDRWIGRREDLLGFDAAASRDIRR